MGWLTKIVEGLVAIGGLFKVFKRKRCEHDWKPERDEDGKPLAGPIRQCSKCLQRRLID